MRFKLDTIVDITETNARRGEDKKLISQQSNYNTMFQTIGLRVNAEPLKLSNTVIDVSKIGFGDSIKGKQRVWTFEFDNPYEGALTVDMLVDDFDIIPVITGLDETVNIQNNIFSSKHPSDRNIIFSILDVDDK